MNKNNISKILRIYLKKHKITNLFYNALKYTYYFIYIHRNKKKYLNARNYLSNIYIEDILSTVNILIHSNKSLGRFGDGEFSWILNESTGINEFEKPSKALSYRLINVLQNKNNNFMIGLPNQFLSLHNLKRLPKAYWYKIIVNKIPKISKYLNTNEVFYNADVTRPYMDYVNKKDSGLTFYMIKQLWRNKDVLIIEGRDSRIGVKDDLLNDVNKVKRIECPVINAFESYNKILSTSVKFLSNHKNYMSLVSLGPTATVLSYDLCRNGYRAIDVGNIDIEYNWYKLGVNKKVNLPYKYVNEVIGGQSVKPVSDEKYTNEIVDVI